MKRGNGESSNPSRSATVESSSYGPTTFVTLVLRCDGMVTSFDAFEELYTTKPTYGWGALVVAPRRRRKYSIEQIIYLYKAQRSFTIPLPHGLIYMTNGSQTAPHERKEQGGWLLARLL